MKFSFPALLGWLSLVSGGPAANKTSKGRTSPLVDHPACKGDLISLGKDCDMTPSEMRQDDLSAMVCAQNVVPSNPTAITETCEQVIWSFKLDLTRTGLFVETFDEECRRDKESFESCNRLREKEPGKFMSCVVERDRDIDLKVNPRCSQFLFRIESVIFSDYRLIGDFAESCKKDIEGKLCGKISRPLYSRGKEPLFHHSQGTVIQCLMVHITELTETCQKETLKLAELQSEDYHLDRALFFACQKDREVLCPKVRSGHGRVYDCLLDAVTDDGMSEECKTELRRREEMISEDYKISRAFAVACSPEITRNKCQLAALGDENPITSRSRILLCLEDVQVNREDVISDECLVELGKERKVIMSDYGLSPEIALKCKADVDARCRNTKGPGSVIHCLMAEAEKGQLKSGRVCEEQLITLIKEVNLASNWALDPVLMRACQEVVVRACPVITSSGHGEVMECLLQELEAGQSASMTQECGERLLEVQYFLSRDFSLTPKLYVACRDDGEKLCRASTDWHAEDNSEKRYVFPCLVRHLYPVEEDEDESPLSPKCQEQVLHTLRRRSKSVRLHPEIEENCRADLSTYCPKVVKGKSKELQCLQDNLNKLSENCRKKVVRYTRIQAQDANLVTDVIESCGQVIQDHCGSEVDADIGDGSLMRCLLSFKETRDENEVMNPDYEECERAISKWQKTANKDVRFSARFWKKCGKEINRYCGSSAPSSKSKIVSCLANIVTEDSNDLKVQSGKSGPRVSHGCENELKFELLQKHSNHDLNPEVALKCKIEIETKCVPGSAMVKRAGVLECLKSLRHKNLNPECRRALFIEEKEEATFNSVDQYLMSNCKKEIKQFCREGDRETNGIINCLKLAKDESEFGAQCRKVLRKRIIQQSKDYRLNPKLQVACVEDMTKHCQSVIQTPHSENDFLEGRLLGCLTKKLAVDRSSVSPSCRAEIRLMIREASLDFEADPILLQNCPQSIKICKSKVDLTEGSVNEDKGRIEECLKELYEAGQISGSDSLCKESLARRIELESVDIGMDPLLKSACAIDINRYCLDVPAAEATKCLVSLWESKKAEILPRCSKFIEKRAGELTVAVREYPIENLKDLYIQLSTSPQRNYFATALATFVICIFVFGLLCGRATRRARKELLHKVR